jgi:hypothetical protein
MGIRDNLNKANKELPDDIQISFKVVFNEYRVNFKGGGEETAYYTPEIEDAIATGIDMSDRRKSLKEQVAKANTLKPR